MRRTSSGTSTSRRTSRSYENNDTSGQRSFNKNYINQQFSNETYDVPPPPPKYEFRSQPPVYPTQHSKHQVPLVPSTSDDNDYDKHMSGVNGGLHYDELSITSFYSDADGIIQVANNKHASHQNSAGTSTPTRAGLMVQGKAQHHPWVEETPAPVERKRLDLSVEAGGKKSKMKKKKSTRKSAASKQAINTKKKGSTRSSSISRVYGNGGVLYDQINNNDVGTSGADGYVSSSTSSESSDGDATSGKAYRTGNSKKIDSSSVRTSTGMSDFASSFRTPTLVQGVTALSAAAITGGLLLGPVGVLLGAGALVAAAGYQTLPEEQRLQIQKDAQQKMTETYEFGERLSDKLGNSCAVAFEKSGDVIGCHNGDSANDHKQGSSTRFGVLVHPSMGNNTSGGSQDVGFTSPQHLQIYEDNPTNNHFQGGYDKSKIFGVNPSPGNNVPDKNANPANFPNPLSQPLKAQTSLVSNGPFNNSRAGIPRPDQDMAKLIASSRRTVRPALPVSQIHALEPQFRPRAWLDLMCDPYASSEDKNEAMEEILILAKDKHHGRMFLEEGILDALLTILNRYFELHKMVLSLRESDPASDETLHLMDESHRLHQPSMLAANLCVALGKAHCAVVHTEGDLLLMSSYKQGTVPEGRQLAQMLYEIPHRFVIPTGGMSKNPVSGRRYRRSDDVAQNSVRYRVKEMSLEEAEELAKMIKDLTEGKMNPMLCK